MKTSALLFMLISQGIITILTIYFFLKVLFSKPSEGSFCKEKAEKS
jgi:hypothetical protein